MRPSTENTDCGSAQSRANLLGCEDSKGESKHKKMAMDMTSGHVVGIDRGNENINGENSIVK